MLASSERAYWLTQYILVHEPELRSWLGRRAIPGLDIDDVIQESYAILAGMKSTDHIHNPRIYLFEVAKSVVLQSFRQSRVVAFSALAEFDALSIPDSAPSPEMIAAGRQELGRLAKLIDKLPTKCREAFVLRKVRGLSQRDVASAMGVSENTVEKHIGKALGVLGHDIGRGGNRRVTASYTHESSNSDGAGPATRIGSRD
ncbi:sigma-70 family RNA polymerase sigma factor [Sphingomonas sp.]|uniref:sigma-70 family RNA polymerase sigma factor n=1 Tax=Sphingomonas sp. TaxID=28214 RepID=UPI0025DB28C9|nr:sigma-70 family RNA polymerase sigma factor [Sphingomonas sp.]MBV9528069.1 sigma-70 family RNA polymerase sigma factor [Sphingomonas sp.]